MTKYGATLYSHYANLIVLAFRNASLFYFKYDVPKLETNISLRRYSKIISETDLLAQITNMLKKTRLGLNKLLLCTFYTSSGFYGLVES